MKILASISIVFFAFAASMELPDHCGPLAPYISASRKVALEKARNTFEIPTARWNQFMCILTRLHEITRTFTNLTASSLQEWKQTQELQFANALLHKQITHEENAIYTNIIQAFVARNMAPPLLKLELSPCTHHSMQTTEKTLYKHSEPNRPLIDELTTNLPFLERKVTIQINQSELQRFAPHFITFASEHEIGHYYHIDCVTSTLLQDLIREQGHSDDKTLMSDAWILLKDLMEKEADDFMINNDPKRIALAKKYCISPGHWEFNLEVKLFHACKNNSKTDVEELIADGVMVNCKSSDQHTALHVACYHGHDEIIRILFAAGANSETRSNKGETPLHHACLAGKHATVKLLLDTYRVDPNARMDGGITPLMLAAHHGHMENIELLLAAGAELNARADNTLRAYHFAYNNKKNEASKRLQAEECGLSGVWARLWD